MSNSRESSGELRRIKIPFLLDIIIVSGAEQIKNFETSGVFDRLHYSNTLDLPWLLRIYYASTKFYDEKRDLWFCPFESITNPTYQPRRNYLQEKVDLGYTPEDVKKIAELLENNAEDEEIAFAMVQIVNQRFFAGQEIPSSIIKTANKTVKKYTEAFSISNYARGITSQRKVIEYCDRHLSEGVHPVDVGHNIGETVQAAPAVFKILKANLDRPVTETFTIYPIATRVPRIAVKSSNLDGLLAEPTKPGKTLAILKIGEAARETKEILFAFGTGSEDRVCVFKDFFLKFMEDLRQELKSKIEN